MCSTEKARRGEEGHSPRPQKDTVSSPVTLLAPRLAQGWIWIHGPFAEAIVWVAECLLGRRDSNACTVFTNHYLKLLLDSQCLMQREQRSIRQSLVSVLAHDNILSDLLKSSIKRDISLSPPIPASNQLFRSVGKNPPPLLFFLS